MKTSEAEPIAAEVARMVACADIRLTARQVIHSVSEKKGVGPRRVKTAITALVEAGDLRFTEDCGTCFLEKNYSGCVSLSPHVRVVSPRVPVAAEAGGAVVRLMPGISFGDCRHATTRLSIQALDFILTAYSGFRPLLATALDIGTGSGILAIVAAQLGIQRVLAIDIDPCARKEAADNVSLNGLSHRIEVSDRDLEQIKGPVSLVTANLRLPTLKRYAPLIENMVEPGGALVLSGIRESEADSLMHVYRTTGGCVWKESDGGWCAMAVIKNSPEEELGL